MPEMTPKKQKETPETWFSRALGHIAEGEMNRAGLLLQKVAEGADKTLAGQALNQLGILALRRGNPGEAKARFKAALDKGVTNPVLKINLAVAELSAGQTGKGLKTLKAIVETNPEIPEAWFHLGQGYLETREFVRALEAFRTFLEANPGNPDGQLEVAYASEKTGDKKAAAMLYDKVKAEHPGLHISLYEAARRFHENGHPGQALKMLRRAENLLPEDPIPHHMLGVLYQDLGKKDEAEKSLKKSISLAPTAESYGQLAGLYEKSNQLNDAWATAKLALGLFPGDPYLTLVLARVERRAKKFDQARERLLPLAGKTGDVKLESQIGFQLGWLYDREDKIEEAFQCYVKAKSFAAQAAKGEEGDKNVSFAYIEQMKKVDFANLPAFPYSPSGDEPRDIAFLVGFPRSGTTLLNQVLDSHPGLFSLEEAPTLPAPAGFVEMTEKGYPIGLTDLNEKTVNFMRATYFDQVRNYAPISRDQVLIDKLPLNLVHLPLIWTLFPEAKIILALRNPFGAVLSNFMHNFKLNNAMANMFTLDGISRYYSAVMDLWVYFTEKRDFSFHAVKYENLVTNFKAESEKLCSFLGVKWSGEMENFSKHAQKKGLINTPSYHQVSQPLYAESLDRWKRYEKQLAPYRERLLPFCKQFEYKI